MNYTEFKRQLGKASLSTKEFAKLLKMTPSSITNYARNGEVPNHLAIIAFLMGELVENGVDFKSKMKNLDLKEPIKKPKAFGRNKDGNSENS